MTLVLKKDGRIVEQTISESDVDVAWEERELDAYKKALISDQYAEEETALKFAEIDAIPMDKEMKEKVKSQYIFSPSGVTKEMVDKQQKRVDEIHAFSKK